MSGARAGRVAAVLLAAGAARRFGSQKLLHPVAGAPLVRHSAESLLSAALEAVLVVVGSDAHAVRAALDGLPVRIVEATDWEEGMAASLRAGVGALGDDVEAVVIALGDEPSVGAGVIDPLVAAWRTGAALVVAPTFGGAQRPPVLFDRALFPELLALRGDHGARRVIARDPARVQLVPLDLPEPHDVDRIEDVDAVEREVGGREDHLAG